MAETGVGQRQATRDDLADLMHPTAYGRNPFRVLGLPAGVTRKDIERRAQLLRAGFDLPPGEILLPLKTPATPDELVAAERALGDPVRRFLWEFLWFGPFPPAAGESQALGRLAQGDLDGSAQVWESESQSGDPLTAGRAVHNLAVLNHFLTSESGRGHGARPPGDLEGAWTRSMAHWRRLAKDDGFWRDFAGRAEGNGSPRLKAPFPQTFRSSLMPSVSELAAGLTVEACRKGTKTEAAAYGKALKASGLSPQEGEAAAVKALEPLRAWLKRTREGAEKEAEAGVPQTPAVVRELLDTARPAIDAFDLLLGAQHPVRVAAHDDVAAKVLSVAIDYASETKRWKDAIALLEEAKTLAAGEATRSRIAQNIKAAESHLVDGVAETDLGGTCYFCGNQPASREAAVPVPMHKVTSVSEVPGGRMVKYRENTVMVPRCHACRKAQGSPLGCFVVAGFLLLGYLGFALSWPFLLGAGALLIWLLADPRFPNANPGHKHPTVLGLLGEGWQLGKEPPS